jgi:hypothetical protein
MAVFLFNVPRYGDYRKSGPDFSSTICPLILPNSTKYNHSQVKCYPIVIDSKDIPSYNSVYSNLWGLGHLRPDLSTACQPKCALWVVYE